MPVGNHTLPQDLFDSWSDGLFYCMVRWSYDITNGMFWTFMFVAFLVAMFMSVIKFETKRAFGFVGFISIVGAIFLATLKLMPWWIASAFIIVGILGVSQLILKD